MWAAMTRVITSLMTYSKDTLCSIIAGLLFFAIADSPLTKRIDQEWTINPYGSMIFGVVFLMTGFAFYRTTHSHHTADMEYLKTLADKKLITKEQYARITDWAMNFFATKKWGHERPKELKEPKEKKNQSP